MSHPTRPSVESEAVATAGAGAEADQPWYAGVTRYQWLVLLIACLGWIFDVFEGQIFVASMNEAMPSLLPAGTVKSEIDFYNNLALAAFLVGGAVGGVGFGVLSDRVGRVRTMMLTILVYSAFTCLSAFSQTWWHMVLLRFVVALGIGGEWAVASAMVAEVFPKRARAVSLGIFHGSSILGIWVAVAAGVWIVGNPALGWRWGFAIGVLPALLTVWIYVSLREPEQWIQARREAAKDRSRETGRLRDLFKPGLLRPTLVGLALATVGLATFWGVYIQGWNLMREIAENQRLADASALAPAERQRALAALSAADRSSIKSAEMLAMFLVSGGGGIGLLSCGPLSNRIGRRGTFLLFCLAGAASSLVLFEVLPAGPELLLWAMLPVFGFFATGMHAGYAIYFPELFPTRLRGTGGGFCFNGGRLLAAPILIVTGWMRKDLGMSLADTAATLSLLFLLGVVVLLFAPETKGKELPT